MSAALTASIEGLQTLIVEKTPVVGGSTAVSGGAVWIPNNPQAHAVGHPNSIEKAKLYLDRIVGNWTSDEMKLAFLGGSGDARISRSAHAAEADRTHLFADYYPDVEGASTGGRSMDPAAFDGRELGNSFRSCEAR